MKPVDHVTPTVPGNWVRRVENKRRQKDPNRRAPDEGQQKRDEKAVPGQGPDGRTHIIDDLA